MFYVYAIFRLDGSPCYIGKGKGDRVNSHKKKKKHHPNPHLRRIYANSGGDLPAVIIQSGLTEPQAFEYERAFISAIGREANGGPLVNLTDGGEGSTGHAWSSKQKHLKSIEMAKRWKDASYKEKMANHNRGNTVNLGRKHSEKTKAAAAQRMIGNSHRKGMKFSNDTLEYLRQVRSDPKFKENVSRTVKSLWDDPAYRSQQMASRAASEAYQNRASNRKKREECNA